MSSSARSRPGAATRQTPAGRPSSVRTGRLTAGRPASAARQVSRMVALRSPGVAPVAVGGATEGALGSTSTRSPTNSSTRDRAVSSSARARAAVSSSMAAAVSNRDRTSGPSTSIRSASQGPWACKFADFSLPPRHNAAFYYDLLSPLCARVDVWRTTYHHPLPGGAEAVVEWFKGSALRPYLARLDEQEQADFLQLYLQAMQHDYPAASDGRVLLPFPRLFVVATR